MPEQQPANSLEAVWRVNETFAEISAARATGEEPNPELVALVADTSVYGNLIFRLSHILEPVLQDRDIRLHPIQEAVQEALLESQPPDTEKEICIRALRRVLAEDDPQAPAPSRLAAEALALAPGVDYAAAADSASTIAGKLENLAELPNRDLCLRIQANDPLATEVLLLRYKPFLERLAGGLLGKTDVHALDHQDVVQLGMAEMIELATNGATRAALIIFSPMHMSQYDGK